MPIRPIDFMHYSTTERLEAIAQWLREINTSLLRIKRSVAQDMPADARAQVVADLEAWQTTRRALARDMHHALAAWGFEDAAHRVRLNAHDAVIDREDAR